MLAELEQFYADYCSSIREEADTLRGEKMPPITEELFAIYENTGNRLTYEGVYFLRRKYLAVFGLKGILDGEERDIRKLEAVIQDICGEECWALPAHVNRKADENWRIYIDLFASETAQTLAEITCLLRERLSTGILETVRREVTRRVLIPFAESRAPYSHWEYGESNWCAVCGGSIGSAALYLMGEESGAAYLKKGMEAKFEAAYPKGTEDESGAAYLKGTEAESGAAYLKGTEDESGAAYLEGMEDESEAAYLKGTEAESGEACLKGTELETKHPVSETQAVLRRILDRVCYSLEHYYLKSFAEDGTCLEGLGYFTYGMTYFAGFAQQLYEFTKGKRDLFRNEKLAKIAAFQAKCYFPSGKTVSFADGFTDDTFRPGLTCFLARKYPGAGIPPMERAAGLNDDNCYRWMGLYRNLVWTRDYMDFLRQGEHHGVIPVVKEPAGGGDVSQIGNCAERICDFLILPDAQWSICRSGNGAGMAAKGGHNGEPHNHNDVGSFFYINGKDFLLADLGCGEYTRDYFSDKRYDYLCCRSLGHNVPLIDGQEQLAGSGYGTDSFQTDGLGRTEISFAGAYGNPELKSLVRTLDWNEESGTLRVEDSFRISVRIRSVRENLITQWKPEIRGNVVRIQGKEGGCLVTVEGTKATIHCICENFSDHSGIRRDVWLLQWEVPLAGAGGEVRSCFRVEACR